MEITHQKQPQKQNKNKTPKISKQSPNYLELSHSQFEAIFAAQNDVVILYDAKMNVYRANPSFFNNYGFDPTGLNVIEIIRRVSCRWLDGRPLILEDQPTPRALHGERVTGAQYIVRKADGNEAIVETSSGPVKIGEKVVGSVTVWHDITELKRVERELMLHKESLEVARQESEERYQDLFKKSPGAIILHDGVLILEVNPAIGVLLGLKSPDDLIGTKVLDIFSPEDRESVASRIRLILNQETSLTFKEMKVLRKDNSAVYVESVSAISHYHGRKVVQVILRDISKRKQLEMELKETNLRLHELTQQMMTTLEEERRMISRELHDEAGQALTALKMYIELILKGLPAEASGVRQMITEAVVLTDQTLNDIRRLAQDLRPPGLDALGLNFTLEDFCYEFGKRVGLDIKYQGCKLPVLTVIARISLYRFLQEALTNVVKHAKADSVQVRLGYCRQQISLIVKDNGIGFESNNEGVKRKSLGLVGMQERLAMLGGTLTIDSKLGLGTRLTAMIPWEVSQ